jgi:uncharacterized alkaline shock family protein YloU
LIFLLRGVTVYALVGSSGTGKSFRAKLIAGKHGIDYIIDDGVLIYDNKIVAGTSAKKEKIYLKAIKTALFDDDEHRKEVTHYLEKSRFKRILLIGTSEAMVKKIAKRLNLPVPSKIVRIEEIASKEEIEKAQYVRKTEGKHVIPVPSIEIKRNMPHIFYEGVKVFLRNRFLFRNKSNVFEKAVVRPEFSKRGKITISETALSQMVLHCIDEYNTTIEVNKIVVIEERWGYKLNMDISVPFGVEMAGTIHRLQEYIIENIERYTGILIEELNITIDKVST